jgi:hypothetical protein
MKSEICSITVRFGEKIKTFEGRAAWALSELLTAGGGGCTPITHPGPRWSDYVFKLRREGLNIETITEKHGGVYAGHHARYVLRTPVSVVELKEAA